WVKSLEASDFSRGSSHTFPRKRKKGGKDETF
ncbi:unnamed protein product, partial [marine sediment metagenome]